MRPDVYTHRENDIGAEALTPGEITKALGKVAGRELVPVQIPKKEAEELAKSSMGIAAQLFFNERSARMDLKALREAFPEIKPVGFEQYLWENKDVVRKSFS